MAEERKCPLNPQGDCGEWCKWFILPQRECVMLLTMATLARILDKRDKWEEGEH